MVQNPLFTGSDCQLCQVYLATGSALQKLLDANFHFDALLHWKFSGLPLCIRSFYPECFHDGLYNIEEEDYVTACSGSKILIPWSYLHG